MCPSMGQTSIRIVLCSVGWFGPALECARSGSCRSQSSGGDALRVQQGLLGMETRYICTTALPGPGLRVVDPVGRVYCPNVQVPGDVRP